MKDKTLSCLFSNTLPNTLDTTAEFEWETRCNANGTCNNPEPLSFVITGDIDAMWLRDSMNQVLPYMEFAAQDDHLKNFLAGLINRQTKQILADVYANSHSKSVTSAPSPHTDDQTTSPGFLGTRLDAMVPGWC